MDLKNIPKLVINLDHRKDRLKKFNKEFKNFFGHGQSYIRIDAEYGDPTKKYIALSHQKAIQFAKTSGFANVCIMEDDVRFTSHKAFEYMQYCLDLMPLDWDILLGGSYTETISKVLQRWVGVSDFSGLQFYIVGNHAFDTILNMDCDMHIDRWMGTRLKCYRTFKIFALQHNGFSDNIGKKVRYDDLIDKENILI